jgi:hypothetical protein
MLRLTKDDRMGLRNERKNGGLWECEGKWIYFVVENQKRTQASRRLDDKGSSLGA